MNPFKKAMRALLWALPYVLSGVAAPILFHNIPDRNTAGKIAGGLFLLSGMYAIFISHKHKYPSMIRLFLIFVFLEQAVFWSWRICVPQPLIESFLLGISGPTWHRFLTGLYLISLSCLVVSEARDPSAHASG